MGCAMLLSTLFNEFMIATFSSSFINFNSTTFVGIRSIVAVSQGWYFNRDTVFGIVEEVASLKPGLLMCVYVAITFYLLMFTIIIAGMYTGRMLEGLFEARAKIEELRELKYKNELNLIGLQINAKKKKIDKQRNRL